MSKLAGKTALVTGASRGIGRAVALELAGQGARVAVNHRASPEQAAEVAMTIQERGGDAIVLAADVSDFAQAQELLRLTVEAFGSIDILVNNAGITRDTLLMRMKESDWDLVLDTNLKGVFNCCRATVRPMLRARKGGRIINISSVSGLAGQFGQVNYSASKAGIIGFTYALAKEVGSRGITVNAVAPGYVPTALTEDLSPEITDALIETTPLGRFGRPEDIAHAVAFLASEDAGFITGVTLRVDGGLATGT